MADPEVIELNSPGVEVFAFGPADLGTVDVVGPPGGGGGALILDDLLDVAGTSDGTPGQALVKGGDGIWIPQVVGGGGGTGGSYSFIQDAASTVWLIGHGLGFEPAGIVVRDNSGNVYYPDVEYVDLFTVRLTFGDSVRGTAHLS